jgi:hypothetical protein
VHVDRLKKYLDLSNRSLLSGYLDDSVRIGQSGKGQNDATIEGFVGRPTSLLLPHLLSFTLNPPARAFALASSGAAGGRGGGERRPRSRSPSSAIIAATMEGRSRHNPSPPLST